MGRTREPKPEQMRRRLEYARYINSFSVQRTMTLALQPADPDLRRERFCPYEFKAPRSRKDPVLRLMRDVIFALNETPEHGLLMWNNNIRVVASTTAPVIWPPNATDTNDVKFYTFTQDKTEFPPTLPVSIIPRTGELTADKLHVRMKGAWIQLPKFLLELADSDILLKRSVESASYFWYKRTPKTFRIMDLPTEVRLQILELAMAPMGEIYPLSKACHVADLDQDFANHHITLGIGYTSFNLDKVLRGPVAGGPGLIYWGSKTYENSTRKPVPAPNMSLLCVSKEITKEALKAAWQGPTKCFLDHWLFIPVLESRIGAAVRFNCLNRIELAFTPRSWFKFFGVAVTPMVYITEAENMGYYLQRLAKNTAVSIRFRDPSDGYAGDPWGDSHSERCQEWDEGTYKSTTCQSVLVNWILTFAYDHIKHTAVTITGFVRKPQREYWNEIFYKARRGEEHEHDNKAELQAIFDLKSSQLPPPCICRQSCACFYKNRFLDAWNTHSGDQYMSQLSNFDFEDDSLLEEREVEQPAQAATDGDSTIVPDDPDVDWSLMPLAPPSGTIW